MAFRFGNSYWVKEGILDNSSPGITTGEVEFAGLGKVILELEGNMENDFQGKKIRFQNDRYDPNFVEDEIGLGSPATAEEYMRDFERKQIGKLSSFEEIKRGKYLYFSWSSESSGLCTIELDKYSLEITPQ